MDVWKQNEDFFFSFFTFENDVNLFWVCHFFKFSGEKISKRAANFTFYPRYQKTTLRHWFVRIVSSFVVFMISLVDCWHSVIISQRTTWSQQRAGLAFLLKVVALKRAVSNEYWVENAKLTSLIDWDTVPLKRSLWKGNAFDLKMHLTASQQ